MGHRRLVMAVTLSLLGFAGCGCSMGSSTGRPSNAGRVSTRSVLPLTPAATSPTTTATTAPPSGVATTVPIPSSPAPGWSQTLTTLPPGGGFSSVSCISNTFCIASGGGTGGRATTLTAGSGVTVSWDGAAWSEPSVYFPAPATGTVTEPVLPTIACTSGPTCMIVDGSNHASIGDGTNWSSVVQLSPGPPLAANPSDPGSASPDSREAAVSCPSPKFCAVMDNTGHASVYRDGSWLPTQSIGAPTGTGASSSTASLYQTGRIGISCPTSSKCVAVVGTSVLDWNGSAWSLEPAPWTSAPATGTASDGDTEATAVSCPTTTLCAIVSGTGLSYRNGGGAWSPVETIDPNGGLDAISCPTTTFCQAADSAGSVVTWNGTSWSAPQPVIPQSDEYPGIGTSLSCPSAQFCMIMNADGDFATFTSK